MAKNKTNRIYWPNCQVCQYMKKHPDFRRACLNSTYFNPNGKQSLVAVLEAWDYPVKQPTLYAHMHRHQRRDIDTSKELMKINGQEDPNWQRTAGNRGIKKQELDNTLEIIEAPTGSTQTHEIVLDEFIVMARAKLKAQAMNITSKDLLQAVKTKADIDSKNKDRKVDLLRSMFAGAAPTEKDGRDKDPNGA